MKKIGIIGLGLIGGSIAKAAKKRCLCDIVAYNRSEKPLKDAFDDGVIKEYSTKNFDIFFDCDVIFICTPVDKISGFVENLLKYINSECIITDVGSTKYTIYNQMLKYDNICFIGGHPMAGSEETGYSASKEHLFENAYYVLTPLSNVKEEKLNSFVNMIKSFGAIPVVVSPKEHDYAVAAISHVPHVIAASLVNMIKNIDTKDKLMYTLAAGGFKDITRIASSSPEMWSGICKENKKEILRVIENYREILTEFEMKLKEDDNIYIQNFFNSSKNYRNSFAERKNSIFKKQYDIFVDVQDSPGIIAEISTMLSVNNINIKNIGIINSREYQNGILQIIFEHEYDKERSLKILKSKNYFVYTK